MAGIFVVLAPRVAPVTNVPGVIDVMGAVNELGTTSSTPAVVTELKPVKPYQALPLASITIPIGLGKEPLRVADTGVPTVPELA